MVTPNLGIDREICKHSLARILQKNAEEGLFQTVVSLHKQGYSHKEIAKECEGYLENLDCWRISRGYINEILKAHNAGYTYETLGKFYRSDAYSSMQLPIPDFKLVGGCREALVGNSGEGYQFETTHSPAETLSMQDYRKVLEGYVNRLPLYQRDVIVRRFYEGQTLEQVADVYCMSAANASQIERKALGKLNKWIVAMHKRELPDFSDLLESQN